MDTPGFDHGFRAYARNGGDCTLKNFKPAIGGGARNLTQDEMDAYQKAKLLASEANGSQWARAKEVLEAAGFEVLIV